MSDATRAAREVALRLAAEPYREVRADGRAREKLLVLGDPQAPLDTLLAALDRQRVLGDDGRLKPEVGLVSMGDHFDYRLAGADDEALSRAGLEGLAFLRWLAAHPSDQVCILGGNHDFARVMELAHETDETFARARSVAAGFGRKPTPEQRAAFAGEFPHIPTPGTAGGDYAMFSVAQRVLVQTLLLERRMRLGLVARTLDGVEVLVTHAGVTRRELGILGVAGDESAASIASSLSALLDRALADVEGAWRAGRPTPLSLKSVNVRGVSGQEGGGFLNHRPVHPEWPELAKDWAWREASPRRFDPRNLPMGLVQVAGHTGHTMCRKELHAWAASTVETAVSVRTLHASAAGCAYRAGVHEPEQNGATMYLVDPEFWRTPLEAVEVMWLESA